MDEKSFSVYNLEPIPTIFGIPIRIVSTTTKLVLMGPMMGYTEYNTIFGKIIMAFCATPVEPFLTKVEHEIFSNFLIPRVISKYFLGEAHDQIEKDSKMWENKVILGKPYLSKVDGEIMKYRRWFQQFYCENSKSWEQVRSETIQW